MSEGRYKRGKKGDGEVRKERKKEKGATWDTGPDIKKKDEC